MVGTWNVNGASDRIFDPRYLSKNVSRSFVEQLASYIQQCAIFVVTEIGKHSPELKKRVLAQLNHEYEIEMRSCRDCVSRNKEITQGQEDKNEQIWLCYKCSELSFDQQLSTQAIDYEGVIYPSFFSLSMKEDDTSIIVGCYHVKASDKTNKLKEDTTVNSWPEYCVIQDKLRENGLSGYVLLVGDFNHHVPPLLTSAIDNSKVTTTMTNLLRPSVTDGIFGGFISWPNRKMARARVSQIAISFDDTQVLEPNDGKVYSDHLALQTKAYLHHFPNSSYIKTNFHSNFSDEYL